METTIAKRNKAKKGNRKKQGFVCLNGVRSPTASALARIASSLRLRPRTPYCCRPIFPLWQTSNARHARKGDGAWSKEPRSKRDGTTQLLRVGSGLRTYTRCDKNQARQQRVSRREQTSSLATADRQQQSQQPSKSRIETMNLRQTYVCTTTRKPVRVVPRK